jgi:pimeloyl-ACP methyl ester carboxylesterase
MATLILVHGTWARAAHWPALQDGLTVAASTAGEHCRFEELRWSGRNKASARRGAASEILSLIQRIRTASREEKIFVIGHSHGGSAIAYFLKEYSSLAKALSGCAFLSTPFIAIRPRNQAAVLFSAVCFVLIYALSAFFPYTYSYLLGGDYLRNALLFIPITFGLCAALGWVTYSTISKFASPEKLSEEARRGQTADIPPGKYLFLRCSGDEAAAGLTAQLIAWVGVKLSQALELIIRPAKASTWKGSVYVTLVGLTVTWWTSFPSPEDRDVAIRSLGYPHCQPRSEFALKLAV